MRMGGAFPIDSTLNPLIGTAKPFSAIPANIAKEWISLAYVNAIAAQVGLNVTSFEWDDGIDLQIGSTKPVIAGFDWRNLFVVLQVKSTADWVVKNDHISFFLKRSNYEQLRSKSLMPQYLVLYTLPQHCQGRSRWVMQQPEHIEFRSRAFFLDLSQATELTTRNGRIRTGRTVHVPIANRLTAVTLRKMYIHASERLAAMMKLQ